MEEKIVPTFVKGNLWDEIDEANIILVSSNATLNGRKELVMGRGAAKEASKRFPAFAWEAGQMLQERNVVGKVYGMVHDVLYVRKKPKTFMVGLFQVKYHWKYDASLELIGFSAGQLFMYAWTHQLTRIVMNFPGTGAGRLERELVLPFLKPLPDNVIIYEYGK